MTTSSVPYADVPARPWVSADARRWADARVPAWARPVGPAVVLLVAVVMAVMFSPDPVCTVAAPCGADWLDAAGTMLFLPHLVWLFVLPELALVSAPLLLIWMSNPDTWLGGPAEKIADAVVVAALCWGWAAVVARLRARGRQRSLVLDAAGGITVPAPATDDVRPWRRGLVRGIAGAILSAVAGALITTVIVDDRTDDRLARTATSENARVVAYNTDDYTVTVRLPDSTRHRFDAQGSYRVGSSVPVLMHSDWVRLATEPYGDRTGRQALALVLAGLGVTVLGSGLLSRRRAVALRRAPVPVLRVLTRHHQGRTEIFAADDIAALRPVLSYEPHTRTRTALRQALLYGAPGEGGELILASATESGQWLVEVTASPIRHGSPDGTGKPGEYRPGRHSTHGRTPPSGRGPRPRRPRRDDPCYRTGPVAGRSGGALRRSGVHRRDHHAAGDVLHGFPYVVAAAHLVGGWFVLGERLPPDDDLADHRRLQRTARSRPVAYSPPPVGGCHPRCLHPRR
ncbi:hypothetical protein [Streptomyces sp. NBC_00154]|uniref:hypothetical protein n=1 Tax=Streptomyces sp. NBC_00154 TaxID=2975670 RepID=UPI0022527452|nr:hypothetical protein [Streptomyces sp. NBC_00154]MCX5313335.1 hypothetical protein [Streptomyces sp. NBC_00154]